MTAANGDGVVTAQERDIVVDNREAWGEILDSPCMGSCQVLPRLIRAYQAVPLGTPDVERNLGKLTELLREHSGANNGASFHMLLEGALELDEKEEDVFGRDVASTQVLLRFTETSRSWQRMWIHVHGRRFGSYQKGRTRAPPTKARLVSEAKIQQRRRSAATAMVKT